MSRDKSAVLLIYLMLPSLLCTNLHCYYSPYTNEETRGLFKLVVTECPPEKLCYSARGRYGNHSALTHHGCMLLKDCDKVKMIRLKGAIYNTSYSCCDWSYCNTGTGLSSNFANVLIAFLSVISMTGL